MTWIHHNWLVVGGLLLVFGVALPLLVWATRPPSDVTQQNTLGPAPAQPSELRSEAAGVQPDQPAGGSGTAERGRVQEQVEYVIRDGKGRVKDVKKPGGN